jgi:hypothetical protein
VLILASQNQDSKKSYTVDEFFASEAANTQIIRLYKLNDDIQFSINFILITSQMEYLNLKIVKTEKELEENTINLELLDNVILNLRSYLITKSHFKE